MDIDFFDDDNSDLMAYDDDGQYNDMQFGLDGQYNELNFDSYSMFGFHNAADIPLSQEVYFGGESRGQYNRHNDRYGLKEEPSHYSVEIKEEPEAGYSYVPKPIMDVYKQPIPPPKAPSIESDIVIEVQPPVEVRTRTPMCKAVGGWRAQGATLMGVSLWYAQTEALAAEAVNKDILGGTKTAPILPDGGVTFDSLSISESSTKHKEREFFLQLTLLRNDGHELLHKRTRPFYAYSHKKVLQRRGSVKLRTLSKPWGRLSGREQMHVIGGPFIQGPALALIIRTPYGDVYARPLEYYSDSVIFFELPACPVNDPNVLVGQSEVKGQVMLTNDGRTFSNPLDFSYLPDNYGGDT
ncbi:hypothetical protein PROFUN_12642 [Planoprotostelium fungivorum]|uniref:Uncharacterized protein n=1 Tax=Planoprotostelium fungivorum TaxID=1890364 RepID=A0A2P6N756_9EUKA|nr:hypothetical protein PROFUN_12642 [Planoprotostelium fungivorum]